MPDLGGSFLWRHSHSLGKNQFVAWDAAAGLSQVGMGKGLLFHMEISRPSLLLASCLLPSSTVWHFHISPPRAQAHAFLIQLYFLLQIHSAVASLPHFISYQHSILSPRYVCKCFILCSPMAVSDLLKSPYHHVKGSWERIKVVGHLSS